MLSCPTGKIREVNNGRYEILPTRVSVSKLPIGYYKYLPLFAVPNPRLSALLSHLDPWLPSTPTSTWFLPARGPAPGPPPRRNPRGSRSRSGTPSRFGPGVCARSPHPRSSFRVSNLGSLSVDLIDWCTHLMRSLQISWWITALFVGTTSWTSVSCLSPSMIS